MEITLRHPVLQGTIAAIPSKSHVHRLLICASLADGPSVIRCPLTSNDIDATVRCMTGLGAGIDRVGDSFHVTPIPYGENGHLSAAGAVIDCGESGSTMRFLLPVLCALGRGGALLGHGRLPERPLSPLYEELTAHGALLSPQGTNPFAVKGTLTPGSYTIDGSVSSQFISGLLFALPLLQGESTLAITGKLESAPYITLTLQALAAFGVNITKESDVFYRIRPCRYRTPGTVTAEGDWSNGAFWLAAGALSETGLTIAGLSKDSVQGDAAIIPILEKMGASVLRENGMLTIRGGRLRGCEIDGAQIPDLVPVLSVAAAAAEGETVIRNIGRLRLKESDRIASVTDMLTRLGAKNVTSGPDWLKIGGGGLTGGTVEAWNDHRIVMSAGIASTVCPQPVTVTGAEAADKSYPTFFDDLDRLTRRDFICTMCRGK
ncbi:MAG: 3-phosphoshikimate 1-carboxyvinyltransferase [Clostridia bacterium]|nr:3-phosphoshikimate 1-carboxyvinyltransferase [Clostridia bacterium]